MRCGIFLGLFASDWREIYDAENPLACFRRKVFAEERFTGEEAETRTSAEASGGLRWIAKMFEPFG
ncbi:MAG TPA: hypothetical protein VMB47_11650 [Candidatus Aquilonibacter sp.]|nr:hypothetical protein [Candidatus Aquilonibacter sp.]